MDYLLNNDEPIILTDEDWVFGLSALLPSTSTSPEDEVQTNQERETNEPKCDGQGTRNEDLTAPPETHTMFQPIEQICSTTSSHSSRGSSSYSSQCTVEEVGSSSLININDVFSHAPNTNELTTTTYILPSKNSNSNKRRKLCSIKPVGTQVPVEQEDAPSIISVQSDEDSLAKKKREKNRMHAKKSRERKKNHVTQMEEKIKVLEEENKALRNLVIEKMGGDIKLAEDAMTKAIAFLQ